MTRYYFKSSPKVAVQLANGAVIRFEAISNVTGLYKTDEVWIQDQIKSLQDRGVGGVETITQEQYEDIKKKATSLQRNWRDEFGAKQLRQPVVQNPASLVPAAQNGGAAAVDGKAGQAGGGGQAAPLPGRAPSTGQPTKPKSVRKREQDGQ